MDRHQLKDTAVRPRRGLSPRGGFTDPVCLAVAVGAFSLALLTGCGGGKDGAATGSDPDVASLSSAPANTSGSAGGTASDTGGSGRPQLRLDSSQEEKVKLSNAFNACLEKNGFHRFQKIIKDGFRVPNTEDPTYTPAANKCENLMPLPPPELDPKTNPHYMDDYRKEIACLHRHHYMVIPLADGGGWDLPEGPIPPNARELEKRCELEGFGGKD
ncbi:hypothetical protein ACIQPQ_21310 [Streptomyces sp. NPDC091281]|uniref:hypothetical protein n=1 Tax=Streptomyces sp. NPDC091281 TaxID=3365985 RepID=UPI0038289AFE